MEKLLVITRIDALLQVIFLSHTFSLNSLSASRQKYSQELILSQYNLDFAKKSTKGSKAFHRSF